MSLSKKLPTALTIGLVLVTAAAVLIGLPPKELPDRLAKIPDEAVVIDNEMYDTLDWGEDEHPLKMVNNARIPYFVDKITQHHGSRNRTLLDVGCGGGVATIEMAAAGLDATGERRERTPSYDPETHSGALLSYFPSQAWTCRLHPSSTQARQLAKRVYR